MKYKKMKSTRARRFSLRTNLKYPADYNNDAMRRNSISSLPSDISSVNSSVSTYFSSTVSIFRMPHFSWPSPPALVRKILFVDSVFYSSIGLFLIFSPHSVADLLMRRPSDGVHWHLLRCIGGQLLASSSLAWRCSALFPAAPSEVRTTCVLLRLLASLLCAFVLAQCRAQHAELFESLVLHLLIMFFLCNFALYFGLLIITGWPTGQSQSETLPWGRMFYQFDNVVAVTIGMGWGLAPLWILHRQVLVTLDPTHRLCGQLIGIHFMTSHLISAQAPTWSRPADRAMGVETRILMGLCILAAQIWSLFAYNEHWSRKHLFGISVFTTWTSLAISYRLYLFWLNWKEAMEQQIRQNQQNNRGQNDQ